MTSATAPQVSFCIPTYNRSRYLASLLESMVVQLADFPFFPSFDERGTKLGGDVRLIDRESGAAVSVTLLPECAR